MKYKVYCLLFLCVVSTAGSADQVSIQFAEFNKQVGSWNVSVTLKHKDGGWDHYANAWQVVDGDNKILAKRVLHHPHVKEQPFTRSLYSVKIPDNTKLVFIEATDSVHGLSADRLRIDLSRPSGKRYKINR